jgi:hypothetical protein
MEEQQAVRTSVGAWVVGLATILGTAAQAQAQLPAFGMVGLTEGQRAVLHLVLVGAPDEAHPGCRVTASFVDSAGRLFDDARGVPVRRTVTLRPQIATSLVLSAEDILQPGQLRRSIRPVVAPVRSAGTPSDCGCFVANLEVLAANGVTAFTDSGHAPKLSPNPPPPPPICEDLVVPGP